MKELLLIPGPTPVDESVLKAMSQDVISHTSVEFANLVKENSCLYKATFWCS